jgi:hypothetical protein
MSIRDSKINPMSRINGFLQFFVRVIAATILLASLALAQNEKAVVNGKVTDASGAALTGVRIVLKPQGCSCKDCADPKKCECCPDQEATSDDSGKFRLNLVPGEYSVKASGSGFGVYQMKVTVAPGEHKDLNIHISKQG